MAAGAKPFPAPPDSHLLAVLKALHLRRAFACFAIDTQLLVVDLGLRRAAGEAGQIDPGGTQFPKHFVVEWE